MKKEYLLIFLVVLVFIISACSKGSGTDNVGNSGGGSSIEAKECVVSPKLVQKYCTIRQPIKKSTGASILCNSVDSWYDHSEFSGADESLVFATLGTNLESMRGYKNQVNEGFPIWDEPGVGDKAFVTPLWAYETGSQKDPKTATRNDLDDLGFEIVAQKGDRTYRFQSYSNKDLGDNNFCNVEQMKMLANAVFEGDLPKYEKPFCYKEEKNELPDLVKQFCTVKTNLDKSVYCAVIDENLDSPLTISPWEYTPNIKELSVAGGLPHWDEPGIGDESWVTPLISMGEAAYNKVDLTKEDVKKEGFNFYVKKGDKVYQFIVGNDNYDDKIYDEAEYIYSNCNLEQTKSIAKVLFGGT